MNMENDRKGNKVEDFFPGLGKRAKSVFQSQESPLALRHLGNHLQHDGTMRGYSCIGISGFTSKGADLINVWQPLCDIFPDANSYTLEWEAGSTLQLGLSLSTTLVNRQLLSFLPNEANFRGPKEGNTKGFFKYADQVLAKAEAGYGTLTNALQKFSESWERAQRHAHKAGEELARQIVTGSLSKSPLMLIGTDLGTEVILSTLKHLGQDHYTGMIRSVTLLGSTAVYDHSLLSEAFKAVPIDGQIVNAFSKTDMFLKYLNNQSESNEPLIGLGIRNLEAEFIGVKRFELTEDVGMDHFKYERDLSSILKKIRNECLL